MIGGAKNAVFSCFWWCFSRCRGAGGGVCGGGVAPLYRKQCARVSMRYAVLATRYATPGAKNGLFGGVSSGAIIAHGGAGVRA